MKTTAKIIAILALSGLSTYASAAKSGGYIDLGFGIASQKCGWCGNDISNGFGGKIAGGYRFNDHLALEIGFAGGSGDWSGVDGVEESTNTFYGAVVGIYPVTQNFEVFGRFGLGTSSSTTTVDDTDLESESSTGAVFGFGVGYTPAGSKLTWRLEYNRLSSDHSTDSDEVGADGISLISAGVVLGF